MLDLVTELQQGLEEDVVLVVVGDDDVVDGLGQVGVGEAVVLAVEVVAHHRIEEDVDPVQQRLALAAGVLRVADRDVLLEFKAWSQHF